MSELRLTDYTTSILANGKITVGNKPEELFFVSIKLYL